jgi:hypothetical protein
MSAGYGVRLVGKMQVHMPLTESVGEVFWICIPTKQAESIDVIPMKSSSLAKNRAQFTPMRTTAADSRTKLFEYIIYYIEYFEYYNNYRRFI